MDRLKRRILVLLSTLGVALLPARGADPLQPPDPERYLRWGPVRVRPGFAIPVFGYDDNIFAFQEGAPNPGDFVMRLSPRIEGLVLFGHTAFLTFREQPDYSVYASYHSLDYFENRGVARLTFPLRRMGFYVDGAWNRLKDPPASELATRPVRREQRLGAGTIFKFGWRTEAEFGLVRSVWTNEDPGYVSPDGFTVPQLLDRTETGTQVKLRYRVTGTLRVGVDTTRRRIVFDEPAVNRDSVENTILPGVEFGEGGRLFGSARLGWSRLEPTQSQDAPLEGAVGDARLAWRVGGATTLRLDAVRRAGFAIYQSNRYYRETSFEVHGLRYLNRTFGVELGGGNGRYWFPAASQGGDRTDYAWKADAALKLRLPESVLGRRIEYSIGIVHRRRDSTVPGLATARNVFGIGADVGF